MYLNHISEHLIEILHENYETLNWRISHIKTIMEVLSFIYNSKKKKKKKKKKERGKKKGRMSDYNHKKYLKF